MRELFSLDSPFMKFMSRVGDLMLLNFFFIVSCLPVFTIGAACTAMYTVCFRFNTERESGVVKSYFKAFKDNFKQSTILFLILVFCLLMAAVDVLLFYFMPTAMRYVFIPFAIIFVLVLFVMSYTFPLISQFDNTNTGILKNAIAMSIGYLPRTILITAVNILPFVLLLVDLYHFLEATFIWVIIYFAAGAFLNTLILKKVFRPYLPDDTELIQEENV